MRTRAAVLTALALGLTVPAGAHADVPLDGVFDAPTARAAKTQATVSLAVSDDGRTVTPTVTLRSRACGKQAAKSAYAETRQLAPVAVKGGRVAGVWQHKATARDRRGRKVTARVTVRLDAQFIDEMTAEGTVSAQVKLTGKGRRALTCKIDRLAFQADLTAPADDQFDEPLQDDILDEEILDEEGDEEDLADAEQALDERVVGWRSR